jgi:hypothetical protein
MIKITIELIPFGIQEPHTIGIGYIVNDGTGTHTRGNYTFEFGGKKGRKTHGELLNFPRTTSNIWKLLYECLCVRYKGKEGYINEPRS